MAYSMQPKTTGLDAALDYYNGMDDDRKGFRNEWTECLEDIIIGELKLCRVAWVYMSLWCRGQKKGTEALKKDFDMYVANFNNGLDELENRNFVVVRDELFERIKELDRQLSEVKKSYL